MPQQCRLREDILVNDVLYYYTSYTVENETTIVIQNSKTDEVFRWFAENFSPKMPMKFKAKFIERVITEHNEEL